MANNTQRNNHKTQLIMAKKKLQYIISPVQLAFVNSIIHEETNPENGIGIKKGDAFGKIFIEAHPKFKSFKKSKVARELDGE